MKRVCIVTLVGNENFGNRLQNYSLQISLEKFGNVQVKTIWQSISFFERIFKYIKRLIIMFLSLFSKKFYYKEKIKKREKKFKKFTNKMNNFFVSKKLLKETIDINFDYVVIGSDQIWNPDVLMGSNNLGIIKYDIPTFSYAASFGWNEIPEKFKSLYNSISTLKSVSVREDSGKRIIEDLLDVRNVDVLIDPTMLLTSEEWDKVSIVPEQYNGEKYILNYFLGDLSQERNDAITKIAKDNNYKIINILDKNDPFYISGPSEFLWLEKHAELICTDSFHSSVFAILYNRPFIVFDREQVGMANMNSRLDTLLSKFKLKNRKFEGIITEENLKHDYTEAYKILEEERKKAKDFIEKSLNIEK